MTYPNKNFMVDFKLLCCCFSFLSTFFSNPENVLVTLSQSPPAPPTPARLPPTTAVLPPGFRARAAFSAVLSLRLSPALYPTSEKCMCCRGNERIDPFRRPNFSF